MSTPKLYIPNINPIRVFAKDGGKYWKDGIKPYFYGPDFCQKWQWEDKLVFQCRVDTAEVDTVNLIFYIQDADGIVIHTQNMSKVATNVHGCDWYHIGEIWSELIPTLNDGVYQVKIEYTYNDDLIGTYLSEPQYICTFQDDTVKFTVNHSSNEFYFLFLDPETGLKLTDIEMRVEAGIPPNSYSPSSISETFTDQLANNELVASIPFDAYKLEVQQCPNYIINKLNYLFSCDSVVIDGVGFSKANGAKFEAATSAHLASSIWTIDVVKTSNDMDEFTLTADFNDEYTDNDFNI